MPGAVAATKNIAVENVTKISAILKLTFWWGNIFNQDKQNPQQVKYQIQGEK